MSKLLEGDSEPSRLDLGELRTTLATFLRMSQALAIDGGRSMCAAQVGCRHLWLGLSSLKDQEKKQLLNLPLSTASLFGPDFLSFVDRLDSATKASAQLAPHLRPQLPQRTPHRQDKRRRSRSPPRRAAAARSAPRIPAAPEPDEEETRALDQTGVLLPELAEGGAGLFMLIKAVLRPVTSLKSQLLYMQAETHW
ncbi:hypothetical protein WMY93_012256 [Mugilogobius chulae]|uniref:Uncharacterized protein n=1 Tax=Mugilogobius chulae TaxID=88201 RepID=A0AAW0P567_9GOBI